MQKEEDFRNFRTSKRRKTSEVNKKVKKEVDKEVNNEITKEKMLKLKTKIVYVRKTQMRNQAIKLLIETEGRKNFWLILEFKNLLHL